MSASPRFLTPLCLCFALAMLSCEEEEPIEIDLLGKLYAPECDAVVTIEFDTSETAVVNRNGCEGYATDVFEYRLEGLDLVMALPGHIGDPMSVQEEFTVSEDGETLTLVSQSSFFACGNCVAGDRWVLQE